MRTTLLLFATIVLVTLPGCSKDPEDGMVDSVNELADVLKGVKTKSDAEKVKGEVRDLVQQYADYAKQVKEGDVDMEKGMELLKRIGPAMKTISEAMRIPEVAKVLKDELSKVK